MTELYYLQSLPRAGNTILGSLINQSNDVQLTANSNAVEVLHRILSIRETKAYHHFPDNTSIINSAKAGVLAHYNHIDYSHIIDRGPWGIQTNLDYIKEIGLPRKFILLYRPLFECVGSSVKVLGGDHSWAQEILQDDKMIGYNAIGLENILNSDEQFIVITYDDICKNSQSVIDKILDFIEVPKFKLDFNNIKQFEFNGLKYDDFDHPWHTVRTDKIEKDTIDYMSYIPLDIVKKYQEQHNRLHDLVMEKQK
jgi:hypothetical protein